MSSLCTITVLSRYEGAVLYEENVEEDLVPHVLDHIEDEFDVNLIRVLILQRS